jgi:Na+-transporting methylmalonyl-CoA/oxaloacetate decarboxylase gamma subunit
MISTTVVEPKLRSREMNLMHEELARAQHSQRVAEAEQERLAIVAVAAHRHERRVARAARRVERAASRARLAAARAL